MNSKINKQIAIKVSFISIIGNVLLSVIKLLAGIFANSSAMVSDAVHSISDIFTTFVVIIGVKISSKEADKKHPYGHERFECVVAIILAIILCMTGLGIGYSGIKNVVFGDYNEMGEPGILALAAAIISMCIKETMYWYTRAVNVI